jgi:hypothetical protein
MKKLFVIFFALLSIVSVTTAAPEASQNAINSISEFMNQDVHVDGHGVSQSLKMWQSLLAMATPVILFGGGILIGYVRYKRSEKRKFAELIG